MTYTPKVGDRVEWTSYGPHTVTAVGKRHALVEDETGADYAVRIANLTPIPDTVTIGIPRAVAEYAAEHWLGIDGKTVAIGDACRAVLGEA
jgi:hypothetical protein